MEDRVLEEVVIVRGQTNRQTNKQNWQNRLVVVGGYSFTVMKNEHNGKGQMVLWGNNISVRPQALPCNEWPTIKKRKRSTTTISLSGCGWRLHMRFALVVVVVALGTPSYSHQHPPLLCPLHHPWKTHFLPCSLLAPAGSMWAPYPFSSCFKLPKIGSVRPWFLVWYKGEEELLLLLLSLGSNHSGTCLSCYGQCLSLGG